MKKRYVKREIEAQSKNPWADDLAITLKSKEKITAIGKSSSVVDTRTGEVLENTVAMVSKKLVDKEEFVKIFEGGIFHIFGLKKSSKDLFQMILRLYLRQAMTPEMVYFNLKMLQEECGYKRKKQTYLQGLNELINKGFLAEVKNRSGWFWVNPNMFFKGDRLKIIQDVAIRGTASAEKIKNEITKIEINNKQKKIDFDEKN